MTRSSRSGSNAREIFGFGVWQAPECVPGRTSRTVPENMRAAVLSRSQNQPPPADEHKDPRGSELRLGLVRRALAADHRHKPVVALNADQLLKRARHAIDRRSLDLCTPLIAHPDTSGAPCRSSRAAPCRGLR